MDNQGPPVYRFYPDPQANCTDPPHGYSSSGPVDSPVQHQPVFYRAAECSVTPWTPTLPPSSDCTPGLEYLSQIDKILVHQEINLQEVIINFEKNNRYEIKNCLGQTIYFAVEKTNFCTRNCCCTYGRPTTLKIFDLLGREVITLDRPQKCFSSYCFPCSLQEIEIYSPPSTPIGYVVQIRHPYLPKFMIQNENKKDILRIAGPYFICKNCGDIDFEIKPLDEENVVGKICKQWTDFVREMCTDYSSFSIHFPSGLDVKMKAVTLGACFLIDFMFFESDICHKILNTFLRGKLC